MCVRERERARAFLRRALAIGPALCVGCCALQGYLAHKETHPKGPYSKDHAQGPTAVLGGGAVSYERGTPVHAREYLAHKKTPIPLGTPWALAYIWVLRGGGFL